MYICINEIGYILTRARNDDGIYSGFFFVFTMLMVCGCGCGELSWMCVGSLEWGGRKRGRRKELVTKKKKGGKK